MAANPDPGDNGDHAGGPGLSSWETRERALRWFEYEHLPADLQDVSARVYELAALMWDTLRPGAEKSAGLRKLLEAKDAFVRQAVDDRRNH